MYSRPCPSKIQFFERADASVRQIGTRVSILTDSKPFGVIDFELLYFHKSCAILNGYIFIE